jgi:hypothetical protein
MCIRTSAVTQTADSHLSVSGFTDTGQIGGPDRADPHPTDTGEGATVAAFMESHLRLAATASAAGCARRHVQHVTARWGLGHISELAALLALELVDSAIGSDGKGHSEVSYNNLADVSSFTLRMEFWQHILLMETWDRHPLAPHVMATGFEGAGLYLVPMLAARWHYYQPPYGGKVVWCELVIPSRAEQWLPRRKPRPGTQRRLATLTDLAVLTRVRDGLYRLNTQQRP